MNMRKSSLRIQKSQAPNQPSCRVYWQDRKVQMKGNDQGVYSDWEVVDESDSESESSSRTIRRMTLLSNKSKAKRRAGSL